MTREEMVNAVISKFGFESSVTIGFCEIAETWLSDYAVEQMFEAAMIQSVIEREV